MYGELENTFGNIPSVLPHDMISTAKESKES